MRTSDQKSIVVNQQEHQELKDQIEELNQALAVRDSALKHIISRHERLNGQTKILVFEE